MEKQATTVIEQLVDEIRMVNILKRGKSFDECVQNPKIKERWDVLDDHLMEFVDEHRVAGDEHRATGDDHTRIRAVAHHLFETYCDEYIFACALEDAPEDFVGDQPEVFPDIETALKFCVHFQCLRCGECDRGGQCDSDDYD